MRSLEPVSSVDSSATSNDSIWGKARVAVKSRRFCYEFEAVPSRRSGDVCYDLMLHAKDGSVHRLVDYKEISEVADITAGGCSLEMVAALYDDRSIRSHVRRARELLSLSTLHASLSTSLALQHEKAQERAPGCPSNG
ncbi:hypothetical protein MRB53_026605 [Persea americana]|uniref:Uncharacterized protein n=1 Tax=Persea americana TaxID=3435 RepID=A0ACC2LJR6_PERAE|nr:hypothetical protein MRB53_026605 [Persea americana]